jgi:hypothetical protein
MSDGQFDIPNVALSEVEAPGADHWCIIRDTENDYALTIVYGDPKQSYVIPGGEAPIEITPLELSVDTDDWGPDDIESANVVRISSDAPIELTGIVSAGVAPHAKKKLLINVGDENITLKHEHAGSIPENRFLLVGGGDILLQPNDTQDIYYDVTDGKWRSV